MTKKSNRKNILVLLAILIVLGLIIFLIIPFNKDYPTKEELNVCEKIPVINYFSCENGTVIYSDDQYLNLSEIDKNNCNVEINANEKNNCYTQLAKKYLNSAICKNVYNNSQGLSGRIEDCEKKIEKEKYILDNSLIDDGTNYTKMVNQIVKCNSNVIYEKIGNCYSKWNQGCYYDYSAKACPNYGGSIELKKRFGYYGFSNEESLSLCEKFVSEGMKVHCIDTFS